MNRGVSAVDQRVKVDAGMGMGVIWLIGWLFTIGYLKLTFWSSVLGLIIWPYYLGAAFR
jgi:hypothetical protein